MKTEYYWTFRIESCRYYGEKDSDSLGFITEENREAWQEIMETECHQSYGMVSKGLMIDC